MRILLLSCGRRVSTRWIFAGGSIAEICFRWGYNGSAHFSRAFRDRDGRSPRNYRRSQSSAASV
jgi:AraC-like DNA-binding protein